MKKSLSILLSIAMAFSIFASVAMGAEANLSVEAKYEALKEAGIFTGDGADQAANLDHNMTRAQFTAVLVRAFQLTEDAAASSVYTDLDGAGWAAGYIGAVTKAGLMNGRSATDFAPSADVTLQELATVLVRAFDLQQSVAGVTGTVDEWARGYVGAALQAGLISAKADYTVAALRADLVESAYVVYEIIQAMQQPDMAVKATSAKTLEVTFSKAVDKDKVTFEVKNSVGNAVNTTVKGWNDANTTATLETAINLLAGEYTVTAKGAAAADLSEKITIEDEKIAGIQILSDTAPAVMNATNPGLIEKVNVFYKVVNQYGQDVTRTQSVTWQSSLGTVSSSEVGVLEINLTPEQNYLYRVGSEFTLFGYILGAANQSVNATLKIGEEARVQTVNVLGLYHGENKQLTVDLDNYDDFALLLEVKDQYGNPVGINKLNRRVENIGGKDTTIYGQLNVFSSNPYLVDVQSSNPVFVDNAGENANQIGLKLHKMNTSSNINMGGVATITLSPVYYSNNSATYDLTVSKAKEVASFTMSAPSTVVASGDKDVVIPYVARDDQGNEITDKATLESATKGVNIQPTVGSFVWGEKDGKAELRYTPGEYVGPAMITAIIRANGQMSQIQLNVRDEKVPAAISAMTSIDTTLAKVKNAIKGQDFTILDQYGSTISADNFFAKYALKVEVFVPGQTVVKETYYYTTKAQEVNFTLNQKGNLTLKVSAVNPDESPIEKGFNNVNYTKASEKDFTLRFIDWADIASFEVADIAKVYNNNESEFDPSESKVTVTGKTSSGTKVNIGTTSNGANYTINTTAPGIVVSGDNVKGTKDKANFAGSDVETKAIVNVTILNPNKTENLAKEVIISRATPVVTTVTLKDVTIKAADLNGLDIRGLLTKAGVEIKDQYGTKQTDKFLESARVVISEVKAGSGFSLAAGNVNLNSSISGAAKDNTFKLNLFVGGTPKAITVKVTE